ncbi:MAG: T9SS type A sorting domain-containing protein [Ignavibacteriae bacterium]|nr:T9SS type A sorting domain-containing protein [Ignavibacteriota bacterium]
MKNGYSTDFHEFLMLPNGHVMMMSYHTITYDMSQIVEGGKTDASLVINIIQEQDLDKNVVFEWRNIDYIPITDSDLDLTSSRINYGTINGFDMDDDGNILVSFRNHSEIIKISRATGELMWRMGGPRGEFTFVGEHEENAPYYFARQHNIERLPNGNISLFDNGEFHTPPYSRAAEYSLDEINKVATLVSEWRYPNGNIFCVTAGNAEQLSDGGWFIGYGVPHPQNVKRNAVEVHPDGSIALELSLPNSVLAYRAYKAPWKELVSRPSIFHFELLEGNIYSFNNEEIVTGVEIKFNSLSAASYNEATIERVPYGPIQPEFFGNIPNIYPVSIRYRGLGITSHISEFHFDLASFSEIKNPSKTSIYYREFPDKGLFLMKPTTYDSLNNKLIATVTGFGEIVFGSTENDVISNSPIPFEPLDSIKVLPLDSLTMRWSGKGSFDSFNVQVSTDSNFSSTLIDSNLNSSFIVMKGLTNHTKYFWRVKSILGASQSNWSPIWNFETTDPFISITSPDGGEEWQQGSNSIIRWETNISDSVALSLLSDEGFLISIGKVLGKLNAFEWEITSEFNVGSIYQFKIESISDTTLFDLSNQSFSIIDTITNIDKDLGTIPNEFVLLQNYPNPFNPTTTIKYLVPKEVANQDLLLQLKVYDILGKVVVTLVNKHRRSGNYEVTFDASNLTSGVYYYQLTAGDFIDTKKMMLIK